MQSITTGAFVCYTGTMRQVIVIHGGTTFSEYSRYLAFLATKPLTIDRFTYSPTWKERLQDELGSNYQVLLPAMPNKTNARYSEWKIWFEHLTSIFADDCILVGHSLGAIFLAKYLSENTVPVTVAATILIAAPHSSETNEDLTDFKIESLTNQLTEQAGRLVFFNGFDDPVIALSELELYQKAIPLAECNIVSAPDHFVRAEFPELTALITAI